MIPGNPLASNELASVMMRTGGNLDVALSLAQTARRGMPSSPGVADTLGWIYYQKGAYHSAVDSLREALRLSQQGNSAGQSATPLSSWNGLCEERTANASPPAFAAGFKAQPQFRRCPGRQEATCGIEVIVLQMCGGRIVELSPEERARSPQKA